jgi:hypothetical protein
MTQLSANAVITFDQGPMQSVPMAASAEIWRGSAVGNNAGYARQLVAGDGFFGFADQHIKDATATNGGTFLPVIPKGRVVLTVPGVAASNFGNTVYASDGATFSLSSNGGANTAIGTVCRYISANTALVAFNAGGF